MAKKNSIKATAEKVGKSKSLLKREAKEAESVARFKKANPVSPVPVKKRINRLEFFNEHAISIGASYAETQSQIATARKLKLPSWLVSYVLVRLLPGEFKNKSVQKMINHDETAKAGAV